MRIVNERTSPARQITRWEDWSQPAQPDLHWVEGRSAMELARAFFRSGIPCLPPVIDTVLRSNPRFERAAIIEGVPELKTMLPPQGASGPRNHDLWLRGELGKA